MSKKLSYTGGFIFHSLRKVKGEGDKRSDSDTGRKFACIINEASLFISSLQ